MPNVQHSWLHPQKIVLVKFEGNLTFEELAQSHQSVIDNFFNTGQSPVHLLVDISQLQSFPTNLLKVQQITGPVLNHPAMGWMVIAGMHNSIQRFLAATITQLLRVQFHQTDTLEEAVQFLHTIDSSLRGNIEGL